ncbi:hypothetical protein MTO96_001121 [Rhipicephalus appendiculatus]
MPVLLAAAGGERLARARGGLSGRTRVAETGVGTPSSHSSPCALRRRLHRATAVFGGGGSIPTPLAPVLILPEAPHDGVSLPVVWPPMT